MLGRDYLKSLAGHTDVALGDSEYNRRELEALGFNNTGVFPIAIDTERITNAPRRPALEQLLEDEDCRTSFSSDASFPTRRSRTTSSSPSTSNATFGAFRFVFVGKTDATPKYYAAVQGMITGSGCRLAGSSSRARCPSRARHLLPEGERLHFAIRA